MNEWIQIIIAAVGGGAVTKAIERLNLLRASKRKGEADAERIEIENEDLRFESYKATINDLNERMAEALARMRELEETLNKSNATIVDLKSQLMQANANVKNLQMENDKLAEENSRIKKENSELKEKLGI